MFIYDTHVHSRVCSACAHDNVQDLVHAYKGAGYSGFVLTDHFYHGNTRVDRNLPWEDFVRTYHDTYLEAKRVGDELDFDVIFGLEEWVGDGKEYLLYNISLEFLLANPDIPHIDRAELARRVHAAGGFVSYAHPYRYRDYMGKYVEPEFGDVDAVEIYNACNHPDENERADAAAKEHGLLFTCGSDLHSVRQIESGNMAGVMLTHRVTDGAELVAALREPETRPYIKENSI